MSKKKIIVFDFDKTLTEHDTLLGFYKETTNNILLYYLKYLFLLFFAFLYKFELINNVLLKKIGILIFLKGKSKSCIESSAISYASKVKLNKIYFTDFLSLRNANPIIVTASFEDYVRIIFKDHSVFGSKLKFKDNLVNGLSLNLFGQEKFNLLKRQSITRVDIFYTDSLSDTPIIEISDNVFLIKNGSKTIYKKNGVYC